MAKLTAENRPEQNGERRERVSSGFRLRYGCFSNFRVLDSLMTPIPQIPHEAVFSINKGSATVFKPQMMMAAALAPERLQATSPKGPPIAIRIHLASVCCNFFMGGRRMAR